MGTGASTRRIGPLSNGKSLTSALREEMKAAHPSGQQRRGIFARVGASGHPVRLV
jgi:hypothetical protein